MLSPTYRIPGENDFRRPILMLFLISWSAAPVRGRGRSARAADELMTLTTPKILQCVFQPRSVMIAPAQQTSGSRAVNANDLVPCVHLYRIRRMSSRKAELGDIRTPSARNKRGVRQRTRYYWKITPIPRRLPTGETVRITLWCFSFSRPIQD